MNKTLQPRDLINVVETTCDFEHPNLLIHLFMGGSHQHGARLEDKGDLDLCGVYLEPPSMALGIQKETGYVSGTAEARARNTSKDKDFLFKTLREWAYLATKGNPTILGFIFAPSEIADPALFDSVWYRHIIQDRDIFACSAARSAFVGYGQKQLKRMQGVMGAGKHGQRPELEAQFGYDTKAAMHMLRMMYEGLEFVSTGRLTYPRPEAAELISIRKGEWSQGKVEREYLRLEAELLAAPSPLPPAVDRSKVDELVTFAYLNEWQRLGYLESYL